MQYHEEVVEYEFLVLGVDFFAADAEESEYLQIFSFCEVWFVGSGCEAGGEVGDDVLVDEVVDEEVVVVE